MPERAYRECRIGDEYLLVLDGRVVELFRLRSGRQGESWRWHVSMLGIEGRMRRDGRFAVSLGERGEDGGLRLTSMSMTVDAETMTELAAFAAEAIAVRDG